GRVHAERRNRGLRGGDAHDGERLGGVDAHALAIRLSGQADRAADGAEGGHGGLHGRVVAGDGRAGAARVDALVRDAALPAAAADATAWAVDIAAAIGSIARARAVVARRSPVVRRRAVAA